MDGTQHARAQYHIKLVNNIPFQLLFKLWYVPLLRN